MQKKTFKTKCIIMNEAISLSKTGAKNVCSLKIRTLFIMNSLLFNWCVYFKIFYRKFELIKPGLKHPTSFTQRLSRLNRCPVSTMGYRGGSRGRVQGVRTPTPPP